MRSAARSRAAREKVKTEESQASREPCGPFLRVSGQIELKKHQRPRAAKRLEDSEGRAIPVGFGCCTASFPACFQC